MHIPEDQRQNFEIAELLCPACDEIHLVLRNLQIKTSLIGCSKITAGNIQQVLYEVQKAFNLDGKPEPLFLNTKLVGH